ncbi:GNAT family N-acetyltransferase [Rummeliibacillus stabekisii]|uniref:GNAT family N-acetyltransferase n=1 Tax=Rummeliibacillus stabekisii TaxID=241244 RepID=UPI0037148CD7
MGSSIEIRKMFDTDWPMVKQIYLDGIATGNATFQTEAPTFEQWTTSHHPICRFVAIQENTVIGWIAISNVSNRSVYKGVGEVSVYVSTQAKTRGIGTALFLKLIEESEKQGFWTLQSSIFKENTASIQLHKKMGFREIGYREKIGELNGIWRDALLLERRSNTINII